MSNNDLRVSTAEAQHEPAAKKKKSPLPRCCSVLILAALVLMSPFIFYSCRSFLNFIGIATHTSERGGVAYFQTAGRDAESALDKYHLKFGEFPPPGHNGVYYGAFTRDLFDALPEALPQNVQGASGDPLFIDPYRRYTLFSNEEMGVNVFNHRGGVSRIKGYPLRYYRTADGQVAILAANGPSKSHSTDEAELTRVSDAKDIMFSLWPRLYDPTNGTESGGDLFRVVRASDIQWRLDRKAEFSNLKGPLNDFQKLSTGTTASSDQ